MEDKKDCEECFKIKCRNCGWEPKKKELPLVLNGKLTACPDCGGAR